MGLMDNIKKAQEMAVNKAYDIGVSIDLENGQSYDTTVFQYLTDDAVKAYQPGGKFEIRRIRTTPAR